MPLQNLRIIVALPIIRISKVCLSSTLIQRALQYYLFLFSSIHLAHYSADSTPSYPQQPSLKQPLRPHTQDTPTSSKDPISSEYPTPSENSKSSGASLPKLSKDPSLIARKMERHVLFQGSSAWDKYPDFKEHIRSVVHVLRPSGVKARSV